MNPLVKTLVDVVYNGLEYFNRYYSDYRGFVVDNDDPDKEGRLRVVVPGIIDEPTDYWAPSSGTFSGPGFGSHVIPPNGTLIWVSFEFGNPNKPLWKHGYFGRNEIPAELNSVNTFWFRTPGGAMIEFNDDDEEVRIFDRAGNATFITKKGISHVPRKGAKIFLGSKDKAEQSAVLGENLEKLLQPLIMNQMGINKAITALGSGVSAKLTAIGNAPPTAGGIVAVAKAQANLLKGEVTNINSGVDSANESINGLLNQLPGIKSKKVRLDG